MTKIPNAVEARDIYNKKMSDELDVYMDFIAGRVQGALECNLCEIFIDEYIPLAIKERLQNLGYRVNFGSQCDSPYTLIKW